MATYRYNADMNWRYLIQEETFAAKIKETMQLLLIFMFLSQSNAFLLGTNWRLLGMSILVLVPFYGYIIDNQYTKPDDSVFSDALRRIARKAKMSYNLDCTFVDPYCFWQNVYKRWCYSHFLQWCGWSFISTKIINEVLLSFIVQQRFRLISLHQRYIVVIHHRRTCFFSVTAFAHE